MRIQQYVRSRDWLGFGALVVTLRSSLQIKRSIKKVFGCKAALFPECGAPYSPLRASAASFSVGGGSCYVPDRGGSRAAKIIDQNVDAHQQHPKRK